MVVTDQVVNAFTPSGNLRASINLGNMLLANIDASTGVVSGVSIDIARAFAEHLGVDVEFVVFDSASKSVEAVTKGQADIGFFAIDPKRGEDIAFTAPYLLIEGCYLVPSGSVIQSNHDVDQAGNRVAVGRGSAYDLHLGRELKQAEIVRAPNPQSVVSTFVEQGLEVAAGVKQQLEVDMKRFPGMRLLPGRFMVIQQAMGLSHHKGQDALNTLSEFVESLKSSDFLARALERHSIQGASLAPPQSLMDK